MQSTLVGLFDTQAEADQARAKLIAAGFDASRSSVYPAPGTTAVGTATGMAAGPTSGTTIGTTNSMTGLPAAEHEGVVARFLHKLFGSDDTDTTVSGHSGVYREAFRRGAYGVTVEASSDAEIDRAEAILNACGAVDIDERSAKWRSEGWESPAASGSYASAAATGTESAGLSTGPTGALANADTQKLNVVEEELQVGKRVVSRGGVRVFSRVVEVPVQESVNLTEEHATISRHPVDRPATEADLTAFKEGTMELRDTAEEVVVAKSARVVEEVEIGKEVTHRDETVRDTVRKTEVDVERVPADTAVGTSATVGRTVSTTPKTGGV